MMGLTASFDTDSNLCLTLESASSLDFVPDFFPVVGSAASFDFDPGFFVNLGPDA